MSQTVSLEQQLLSGVEALLAHACAGQKHAYEAKLQLLEAAASRLGGFSVQAYFKRFAVSPLFSFSEYEAIGRNLVHAVAETRIPPALALCALAREPLSNNSQRETGAYHTDFRLALHVAAQVKDGLKPGCRVVDPACGAGILLAAVTLAACGSDRKLAALWLRESVYAADLSANSLRGAALALASFTDDLDAIVKMRRRWFCGDSLLAGREAWGKLPGNGFDVIVANPPWEKIKATRHEFLQKTGKERHYGAEYGALDAADYAQHRAAVSGYAARLLRAYPSLASGEPDMYVAFLELLVRLATPGGRICALVPAGLIRSQGTTTLRRELIDRSSAMDLGIFENRARFFGIDTRFKFLSVSITLERASGPEKKLPLGLAHYTGTDTGVTVGQIVRIGRAALERCRPDLSVPEVRTAGEWKMFQRMASNGLGAIGETDPWYPEIVREVDMTRDRPHFRAAQGRARLPLVEGRMVHQFRFGAKKYVSGTGRRAIWAALPLGQSNVVPQFFIDPQALSDKARKRSQMVRAGFCDITGQTNERSMLATMVPAGTACGNKVPTILFPSDPRRARLSLWVGIANSLAFDWAIRRVLTTTVNYFLLRSVPFPRLDPDSLPGRQIAKHVEDLLRLDASAISAADKWRAAELRAQIDVLVLRSYGLGYEDMITILADFPLLDRAQPALPGEASSTITKDLVLLFAARLFKVATKGLAARVNAARALGAIPYVPSHVADQEESQDHEHHLQRG
ncbi:MAG: class I SAM-dependent methyltransferase [Burkholderiales bacterium]|nr:class I SAM-dependent methyltransferase [Burkholderiales bacterium]